MTDSALDVACIGNAIVDVLAHAEDSFLQKFGMAKGAMALVDATQAEALYRAMGSGIESSGGSAANTAAGVANFGGSVGFIGKVRDDRLGAIFAHDIRAAGVRFDTPPAAEGAPTARCLILVTPDGQRTMNTYLGACVGLGPDDVAPDMIRSAQITHLEGYLFDPPAAKQAFVKASEIAHAAGRKVSLSLSDPFCVDRHRDSFRHLVEHHVDILFANELEIVSLYETPSFDDAVAAVQGKCGIAALTRAEKGAVLVGGGETIAVPAEDADMVVDTTGAGDLYAAGVLYGLTHGYELQSAGKIGAIAAAETIGHFGARIETDPMELVKRKLG